MRPSFFLAAKAPAIKVYLTGDIKLWVLLYIKKSYMILMLAPHIDTC